MLSITYASLLLLMLQVTIVAEEFNSGHKCKVIYDLSLCFTDDHHSMETNRYPCQDNPVCRKIFNISYIKMEPYHHLMLTHLLNPCCGDCVKISSEKLYDNISEVALNHINSSHFIFPVLGMSGTTKIYGYHFIPYVEAPFVYYITLKDKETLAHLLDICLEMWPLITVCLFFVVIAGFIGWALETRTNKEQFSRHFLIGWFEGVWWSFVSMTTVGYGDKAPKSVPARLFAVLWILIGITTFSMITAMFASDIFKINSPPPPELAGARVGALKNRMYDAAYIAVQGGILTDVGSDDDTFSIYRLVQMLNNKEIDGFVLDHYTFVWFTHHARFQTLGNTYKDRSSKKKGLVMSFNLHDYKVVNTENSIPGKKFAYGVLIKEDEDYDYFSEFVVNNGAVINTCHALTLNNISAHMYVEKTTNILISSSADFFWPSFISLSCIIALMFITGMIYEIYRTNGGVLTNIFNRRSSTNC